MIVLTANGFYYFMHAFAHFFVLLRVPHGDRGERRERVGGVEARVGVLLQREQEGFRAVLGPQRRAAQAQGDLEGGRRRAVGLPRELLDADEREIGGMLLIRNI